MHQFTIADESGAITLSLWNEKGDALAPGHVVRLAGGSVTPVPAPSPWPASSLYLTPLWRLLLHRCARGLVQDRQAVLRLAGPARRLRDHRDHRQLHHAVHRNTQHVAARVARSRSEQTTRGGAYCVCVCYVVRDQLECVTRHNAVAILTSRARCGCWEVAGPCKAYPGKCQPTCIHPRKFRATKTRWATVSLVTGLEPCFCRVPPDRSPPIATHTSDEVPVTRKQKFAGLCRLRGVRYLLCD